MKMLFISGWAHDNNAMNSLAEKFFGVEIDITSVHDLITKSDLELSIDSYYNALKAKLNTYDEPPVVIGWSMGAMVLLEILAFDSKLIKKAVLISGTLKFCNDDLYKLGIDRRNVKALKLGIRKDIKSTLQSFFEDCYKPFKLDDKKINDRIFHAKEQGVKSLSLGLDYLLKKDLRELNIATSIPLLEIHGEDDCIIPCSAGKYLCNNLKGSEFISLPGGNHDIINLDSESVYLNIKKFIDNE